MPRSIEYACFILNPIRWEIINAIVKGHKSATSLSKETGKSVAFIGQQLALLEANGFIKQSLQKKDNNRSIGKPAKSYQIAKEMNIIISIGYDEMNIQNITPNNLDKYQLSSLMASNNEDIYFLQKLYYTQDEFFQMIQAIGIIDTQPNEIHLFIIGTDVERIRQEKSSISMTSPEGITKTFILWTHTLEEVRRGLKHHEAYFVEKVTKAKPLWDSGIISIYDLKNELEQIQGKA